MEMFSLRFLNKINFINFFILFFTETNFIRDQIFFQSENKLQPKKFFKIQNEIFLFARSKSNKDYNLKHADYNKRGLKHAKGDGS